MKNLKHLRLPEAIRHCWIVDRGIISRGLCRELDQLGQFVLGRMRCNQVVYFAPEETATGGRPCLYGEKCRVDQLLERFPDRLRRQKMKLRVYGQTRTVDVYSAEVLLRGVWRGRAFPAHIIMVVVPELAIKPWYLLSTDLELDPCEAVNAYDGRYQIEVNFDEVKELGLGHYQGRSAQARTISSCVPSSGRSPTRSSRGRPGGERIRASSMIYRDAGTGTAGERLTRRV